MAARIITPWQPSSGTVPSQSRYVPFQIPQAHASAHPHTQLCAHTHTQENICRSFVHSVTQYDFLDNFAVLFIYPLIQGGHCPYSLECSFYGSVTWQGNECQRAFSKECNNGDHPSTDRLIITCSLCAENVFCANYMIPGWAYWLTLQSVKQVVLLWLE